MAAAHQLSVKTQACAIDGVTELAFKIEVHICRMVIMHGYGCHYFWHGRFVRLMLVMLRDATGRVCYTRSGADGASNILSY